MITPQQIKIALVRLAEFQKRPPYEPCAVRVIIENFASHPLREAVLYFCENDPREQATRYMDLVSVCKNNSIIEIVRRITGVDVQSLLDGRTIINNVTWQHLKRHFDVIEDISVNQVALRDSFEYEASFDMWMQDAIKHAVFNWQTMTYDDRELNEAWLSFQDFRSGK